MTDPTARKAGKPDAETELAKPEAQDPPAQAPKAEPPDPLAEAQRESDEFKDKLLRTLAEMENLRKRTEREIADAHLVSREQRGEIRSRRGRDRFAVTVDGADGRVSVTVDLGRTAGGPQPAGDHAALVRSAWLFWIGKDKHILESVLKSANALTR